MTLFLYYATIDIDIKAKCLILLWHSAQKNRSLKKEFNMERILGWPIVTAENCFSVILGLGIKKWPTVWEKTADEYLAQATDAQKADFKRFVPNVFAARHTDPKGNAFEGFGVSLRPASLVFALIEDGSGNKFVLSTAEYKHGNDRITIVPVAGVSSKAEAGLPLHEQMERTALREFLEETGIELESVESLGPQEGIYSTVRNAKIQMFPFLGKVKTPIQKGPTRLDDNEYIQMVAFPLDEWVKLIETPKLWDDNPDFGLETYTQVTTYLALRRLGTLKM